MPTAARTWIALGAALAGVAVAAGAFGTHTLRDIVSPERVEVFNTAARYQMYHALGLMLVGLLHAHVPDRRLRTVATLFIIGIVLFAGSLYTLVMTDLPVLGAVTPFGGLAFISGWLLLAWTLARPSHPLPHQP